MACEAVPSLLEFESEFELVLVVSHGGRWPSAAAQSRRGSWSAVRTGASPPQSASPSRPLRGSRTATPPTRAVAAYAIVLPLHSLVLLNVHLEWNDSLEDCPLQMTPTSLFLAD